jgi:predicted nucleotidyltransferase component of viral defense system
MSKADSIKARLKSFAITEKKQFDYLLMLYFIERILYRISVSKYKDVFVLKGGLLLYTILDDKARITKDIDLLARELASTLDGLQRIFKEVCSIEADDAVHFDTETIRAERIKEDADYEGVRIKVTAFLDKSKKTLQFDIGFGDVIVPKAVEMEYPSLLDMDTPKIKAYSIESVIAEKFETMLYLADANSRMKDFYDVYVLSKTFCFDGRVLYEAINQTIQRRGTSLSKTPTVFSESFRKLKDKQTQWNAFIRRIGAKIDTGFDDVVLLIKVFLFPIYECMLNEREFFGQWDKNALEWSTNLKGKLLL